MTRTRYLIARLAKAFGFIRRNHRMSEASAELHLLRESETYLGMKAWENVEPIDALSVEYWNLRKLVKQSIEVDERVTAYRAELDAAHEQRAWLVNAPTSPEDPLLAEQQEQQSVLDRWNTRREELLVQARELRRQYAALKTKREVLAQDTRSPENEGLIALMNNRVREIQEKFDQIKNERVEVGKHLASAQLAHKEITQRMEQARTERLEQATAEFQKISEINKELSRLRAEHGLLQVQIRQLYSEVGRHLSLHAGSNPACRAAVKKHQGLVDVMRALRRSVVMNYKLADRE